jgi:hypothetical protein
VVRLREFLSNPLVGYALIGMLLVVIVALVLVLALA